MTYLKLFANTKTTPQTEPLPHRPEQIQNAAGGYVWAVDAWTRLERFLILGSEAGSYYVTERELTAENLAGVRECLRADGLRVVRTVVDISTAGRAPKHGPALFVLALAASPSFADGFTNAAALTVLPTVARTASDLCTFATFVDGVRGWGRGLRSAIAGWYLSKPAAELAYQMVKYRQRGTWTHRDLLRLSHPKADTAAHNALFQWAVEGGLGHLATADIRHGDLRTVYAFEQLKKADSESEVVRLIEDDRLTHEMVPSEWKNSVRVWEALLDRMPYLAMVRNLAKMTAVGLLTPHSAPTALAVARLIDRKRIANSKVHPITLLAALLTYKSGRGVKGSLEWAPVGSIIDALDEAFYLAFENVAPSGRRIYLAIDASGSMQSATVNGMPFLTAAMGAAAMAMVVARTEPKATIAAFHERLWHVDITRKDRLDRACAAIAREPHATNAALPFQDARERAIPVDAFVLLTDNETWAGDRHPVQALAEYRRATGIPAKLAVVAMTATGYSIADPEDSLQMDFAGFDAGAPAVLADFLQR